jgi:carnosine synthase
VAEATALIVSELNPTTQVDLRRQATVAGRVVVFLTAGYEGKRFIFEIARKMNLRVVIIDSQESWSQQLLEEGVIEKFIPMEITDMDLSYLPCVEAIQGVKENFGQLDGIVSFAELAQQLVAKLCDHFQVPGNSLQSVNAARDKYQSRDAWETAGLPTPKHYLIKEEEHIPLAGEHVGFPAVIKPIFGAASIGVVRVDSMEQLHTQVMKVRQQLLSARVINGALQEGIIGDDEGCDAAAWIDLSIMMEQYLDGPEVDVDIIMADGESVYEAMADNWPTIEPYFNETGSNCPSILPQYQQDELRDLAVASVKALGLTMGVFHVEGKYTTHGPRIIEVNCRMGGGPVHLINQLVWGVDLVVEQMILSCGGEPRERSPNMEPLCNIAEYSMNSPISGFIEHTDFLADWQGHHQLVYARPLVCPHQRVTGPDDGMPTWLCEIMCTAPTVEEGIQFVKDVEKSISFPIVHDLHDIASIPSFPSLVDESPPLAESCEAWAPEVPGMMGYSPPGAPGVPGMFDDASAPPQQAWAPLSPHLP